MNIINNLAFAVSTNRIIQTPSSDLMQLQKKLAVLEMDIELAMIYRETMLLREQLQDIHQALFEMPTENNQTE